MFFFFLPLPSWVSVLKSYTIVYGKSDGTKEKNGRGGGWGDINERDRTCAYGLTDDIVQGP